MRVIYRSASKLRFHSNVSSWIFDAAHKASLLLLTKIGRRTLTRFSLNALAWTIFIVCLPLEIFVFSFAWLYSIALIRLMRCLEKDAKKVELVTSAGNDTDIVTLMLTLEGGPPDENVVKERISRLIHRAMMTEKDGKKLKYRLRVRMGCYVWKKDYDFKVENHLVIETGMWRGVQIVHDNLRYWLNYACSQDLPKNRPPWKVVVVPYLDKARQQATALLFRLHRSLLPCFKLSDLLVCQASNFELKKAVAEALQFTKPQPKTKLQMTVQRLKLWYDAAAKLIWILWVTPRVLYTELLESSRFLSAPDEERYPCKSVNKSLFWSKDMPKDLLLKLKQASNVSTTGILMSCLAGATRQYRLQTGEQAPDSIFNLMPYYDQNALSIQGLQPNGFRSLSLPVGVVEPTARLQDVHRALNEDHLQTAKKEISRLLLSKLYILVPPVLVRALGYLISRKYNVVLDNVYLSDSSATLWDKPVTSVLFWRPPSTIGTALSFVHYDDKVSLSLSARRREFQRPDLLVSLLEREVYALALALNVRIERKPSPPSSPTKFFKSLYYASN